MRIGTAYIVTEPDLAKARVFQLGELSTSVFELCKEEDHFGWHLATNWDEHDVDRCAIAGLRLKKEKSKIVK